MLEPMPTVVLKALTDALKKPYGEAQLAIDALYWIGPVATPAVPALIHALGNEDFRTVSPKFSAGSARPPVKLYPRSNGT